VNIADERLAALSRLFRPQRTIFATMEFVDIAGLVKGASQGEGLGNQFLSHIREAGVIAHTVRCFDDPDIVHVAGRVDPRADMETVAIELALADMETVTKRREKAERSLKGQAKLGQKSVELLLSVLGKVESALESGAPARSLPLSADEKGALADCHLLTIKPQLYICNVDEEGMREACAGTPSAHVRAVQERAVAEGSEAVLICGKFEAELAGIDDDEEKKAFLEELGLAESGLTLLAQAAYRLLGLRTFFTVGSDECRAWTIRAGESAPKAAGVIHSDFEKGFIKAEVYSYEDSIRYGSEAKIKEAGRYRVEGREYIVQDGDVMFFKFNV
jgi:GTP-binding protein YchF